MARVKGQGEVAVGEASKEGVFEERSSFSRQGDRKGPEARMYRRVTVVCFKIAVAECEEWTSGWEARAKLGDC